MWLDEDVASLGDIAGQKACKICGHSICRRVTMPPSIWVHVGARICRVQVTTHQQPRIKAFHVGIYKLGLISTYMNGLDIAYHIFHRIVELYMHWMHGQQLKTLTTGWLSGMSPPWCAVPVASWEKSVRRSRSDTFKHKATALVTIAEGHACSESKNKAGP